MDTNRGSFFANFNRDSVQIIGEPMPNEPVNYRFVNGILLPPTPNVQPTPMFSQAISMPPFQTNLHRPMVQQQNPPMVSQMQSTSMSPKTQNTPMFPDETQDTPLIREPTVVVNQQSPSIIEKSQTPHFPFERNKIETSSTVSLVVPIGVRERKDDPMKFDRFGRPKLDFDAYVKFLLQENQMDPGVNILSYNDPEGGKHKASLLPKGAIQADVVGGPVYQRMHFWIKDINGLPRRSKSSSIINEMKRVNYMGVPLVRLIREYEKNHFENRQQFSIPQNEDEPIVADNESTLECSQNSYIDENNENLSLVNVNPPVLVEQTVNQSRLIPLIAEKPRLIDRLAAQQKASVPDGRKTAKKEAVLKLLKRLKSGKSKAGAGGKLRI